MTSEALGVKVKDRARPSLSLSKLTVYSVTQSQANTIFLHKMLSPPNLGFHEEQNNVVCVRAECLLTFLQASFDFLISTFRMSD